MRRVLLTCVALIVLAAPAGAMARRSVPRGFIGMNVDVNPGSPLFDHRVNLDHEMALMARSGVETIRFPIYWKDWQPYGPQFNSNSLYVFDIVLATAANHGLRVVPIVVQAPYWARRKHKDGTSDLWAPPTKFSTYGTFMNQLAQIYGPRGSFWRAFKQVPYDPIRTWQVWNEPNDIYFFNSSNWPKDYVGLLKAARKGLRAADPHAKIISAGLVKEAWKALAKIYRAGGRRYFDYASVHPFTHDVGYEIKIIKLVRAAMRRGGDARKSLWLTETSWPSSVGKARQHFGFEETEKGQARRLRAHFLGLAKLRKRYRLGALFWYTWMTPDRSKLYEFDYAGLRALTRKAKGPRSKPALKAFAGVAARLEGCVKSSNALHCR